jgi:hypothetical protein
MKTSSIVKLLVTTILLWGNYAYASDAQNWTLGDGIGGRSEQIAMTITATSSFTAFDFSFKACVATSSQDVYFDIYRGTNADPEANTFLESTESNTITHLCSNPTGEFATSTVNIPSPLSVTVGDTILFVERAHDYISPGSIFIGLMGSGASFVTYHKGIHFAGVWSNTTTIDNYHALMAINSGYPPADTSTHIVSFSPNDGETIAPGNVNFALHVYINPADLGSVIGVRVILHNIDQNSLFGFPTPSDIVLLNNEAPGAGDLYFSTSTPIAEGNYRLEASLIRSYFTYVLALTPIQTLSHQFIVGQGTFVGNISQNLYRDTHLYYASSSATSTASLAGTCVPLAGTFSVPNCLAYLFIPDPYQSKLAMNNLFTSMSYAWPWGYLTRFIAIISDRTIVPLPSFTANVPIGPGEVTSLTFNPSDMIAGGGTLLDSIHDPIHGMNDRDIFEPWVRGSIALIIVLYIITDLSTKQHEGDIDVSGSSWKDREFTLKRKRGSYALSRGRII